MASVILQIAANVVTVSIGCVGLIKFARNYRLIVKIKRRKTVSERD